MLYHTHRGVAHHTHCRQPTNTVTHTPPSLPHPAPSLPHADGRPRSTTLTQGGRKPVSTDDFSLYMESLVGGSSAVPDFSHFLTDSLYEEVGKKEMQNGKGEEPQQGGGAMESSQDSKVPAEEIAKISPEMAAAVGVALSVRVCGSVSEGVAVLVRGVAVLVRHVAVLVRVCGSVSEECGSVSEGVWQC